MVDLKERSLILDVDILRMPPLIKKAKTSHGSNKMFKRIKATFFVFFCFILFSIAKENINIKQKEKFMQIKLLQETVDFSKNIKSKNELIKNNLKDAAKYKATEYKDIRKKILEKLIDYYNINDPLILIEYAGGLIKRYNVIILTKSNIYFSYWDPGKESFGTIKVNKYQQKSIQKNISVLKSFNGYCSGGIVDDRSVLFMTFYDKTKPIRAFYSDTHFKCKAEDLKNKLIRNFYDLLDLVRSKI